MSYKKITLLLCLGFFLFSERETNAQTASFNYVSNAVQTWTVPCRVTSITVQMWGGGGGSGAQPGYGSNWCGGSGAYMEGVLTGVSPGEVLKLSVPSGGGYYVQNSYALGGWPGGGQAGSDVTFNEFGGGGGGYASLQVGATYYAVAGAGGGGGSCGYGGTAYGGPGGNPNSVLEIGTHGNNGGPGLITAGGAGGSAYSQAGTAGTALTGGQGEPQSYNGDYGGGGGGGGWYGGGGGGDEGNAGGGGSSFPATSFTSAGLTFTVSSNLIGTSNANNFGSAVAPGSPPAGIGSGNYNMAGGNGYIKLTWDTAYVATTATADVTANETCSGDNQGSAAIVVTGGSAGSMLYTWSPNVSSTDTATGLFAGSYVVTVVNPCGGSASTTVTITQPSFFAANPIVNNIPCNGGMGSINANITGGTAPFTYVWSPEGTTADSITGLSVGSYSLNVTDNHGCKTSSLISITQPAALVLSTSLNAAVICNGQSNGAASSSVSGGTYPYSYMWSPSNLTTANINNVPSAVYTLTTTDANGCVQTSTVDVSQPAVLAVGVAPLLNLACNGDNNGVLGSGVTGGVRPYTFLWSNGQVDSNAYNLSAGTYSLKVTDAHGCVTNVSNTVTQPAPLAITMDSTGDGGNCTGSAWVTLSGGTTPYSYVWSNGASTFYADGLCYGKYCCTVTDANGCIQDVCADIYSDLGVGSISADAAKITVYPNPTNGQITFETSVSGSRAVVDIFNVLGEKVYTASLDATQGTNTVNISRQANGVYLYRVTSESGNLLGEGKVILQK